MKVKKEKSPKKNAFCLLIPDTSQESVTLVLNAEMLRKICYSFLLLKARHATLDPPQFTKSYKAGTALPGLSLSSGKGCKLCKHGHALNHSLKDGTVE